MMFKRLKQFIRRLVSPATSAEHPDHVIWREGDPRSGVTSLDGARYRTILHNGIWIAAYFIRTTDDLFTAALMVVNSSGEDLLVDPRRGFLATWPEEDLAQEPIAALHPHASQPANLLEEKRVAPKESVSGELYFHWKPFEKACFVIPIEGVFYHFVISPPEVAGGIEGRT